MTWERALEADARLAARNAVLIRAALRQSFDPEAAFRGYQSTTPDDSLTLPQQRARARAWATINIRVNLEPLKAVIQKLWAEGYALGDTAAREAITQAKLKQKADVTGEVDWSKWKAGDAVSALLLKPPRAFQQLLQSQGIVFKGFSDTTLTDIGNAIGEAIELGLDAKRSAKNILNHVANPARALSIAITEQNRAISQATVNRYRDAGLQEMEWLVFEPCDKCAQNAGKKVRLGAPFPSGDAQPPAHPNCRCALAPVIPGFDDPANTAGAVTQPVISPDETMTQTTLTSQTAGAWSGVTKEGWVERQLKVRAERGLPEPTEPLKRIIEAQFDDAKEIWVKGPHAVVLHKGVTTVETVHIEPMLKYIEEVYEKLPEWRKVTPDGNIRPLTYIIAPGVGGRSGNILAYTSLGHDTMWISAKAARFSIEPPRRASGAQIPTSFLPGGKEEITWSMSAAYDVNQTKYTIAHEFGHMVDTFINDSTRGRFVGGIRRKLKNPEWWSEYSRENAKEGYAEVFAQWLLGERNPVVDAFAEQYGWDLSAKEYYEQFARSSQWKEGIRIPGGVG